MDTPPPTIQVFQPAMGHLELAAVARVFSSHWIGRGSCVAEFEQRFAAHLGVPSELITNVSCCTEGLFTAVQLAEVTWGDDVVLPSISFVGAANAVASAGGRNVFCDVDPHTLNPTLEHIQDAWTDRTKAVLLLHYGGVPCQDIEAIVRFAHERHALVIEDSACSVASTLNGRACGTFGDLGLWSFDAMKILSTGDGGMLYGNSRHFVETAKELHNLGLDEASGLESRNPRWWEFDVGLYGRKAVMNDIAAAIGLVQLTRLPDFIARRKQVDALYREQLADLAWLALPPAVPENSVTSHYFFWIQLAPRLRDHLAHYLRAHEIYVTMKYYPLHLIQAYDYEDRLPRAEQAGRTTLLLPQHQGLSDDDVNLVCDLIRKFPH